MDMLKTCEEDQICTIHRVVTFEQKPVKEKEVNSEFQKVEKSLYHIPTRNKKTGKIEVNTLLKKDLSPVTHIKELPQTFAPLLHPLYMTLMHDFYTQFRPLSRYLKNKFEIFTCILTSLWSPKCILELHWDTHIYTDTQMQMTPYKHSTLVSMIPHTQNVVQIWLEYIQYFG